MSLFLLIWESAPTALVYGECPILDEEERNLCLYDGRECLHRECFEELVQCTLREIRKTCRRASRCLWVSSLDDLTHQVTQQN
jgi:hypothetical protein